MAEPFDQKRILVTGASSGIGRALALELARQGARLALAGRDEARLREAVAAANAAGGAAFPMRVELEQPAAAAAMVEQATSALGGLDVLVNNAGFGVTARFEVVPQRDLERLFAVNVFAVVVATRRALPALRAAHGLVVNVGSVVGRRAVPTIGAYCMTKAAIGSFSEALRAEEARHGVHVLQVEPGLTESRFAENRVIHGDHPRHYESAFRMSAETAALRIARAMARRRDRLVLGLPGRLMILANQVAPWLLNRLLARQ
jgi:short-subunit dehydrogenase